MIALDVLPMLEREARERQRAGATEGGKTAGRGRPKGDSLTEAPTQGNDPAKGESAAQAGKLLGISEWPVRQAKKIKAAGRP